MANELRNRLVEAFTAAAHCSRWEFQEGRANEFVDALDAYLNSRTEMPKTTIDKREEWQFKRP